MWLMTALIDEGVRGPKRFDPGASRQAVTSRRVPGRFALPSAQPSRVVDAVSSDLPIVDRGLLVRLAAVGKIGEEVRSMREQLAVEMLVQQPARPLGHDRRGVRPVSARSASASRRTAPRLRPRRRCGT